VDAGIELLIEGHSSQLTGEVRQDAQSTTPQRQEPESGLLRGSSAAVVSPVIVQLGTGLGEFNARGFASIQCCEEVVMIAPDQRQEARC